MHQFITISNVEGNVELSIGVDTDNDYQLYMPSIIFKGDKEIYWDNPSFIFENFYNFLNKYINGKDVSDIISDFKEILHFIEIQENAKEILEMLDLAIKQNWDKTKI